MREPMLAEDYEMSKVEAIIKSQGFGYVQPKIDGMRMTVVNNMAMTRSMKTHPNVGLKLLANALTFDWDGEVTEGHGRYDGFRDSTALRRKEHLCDFTFWVFDTPMRDYTYEHWTDTIQPCADKVFDLEYKNVKAKALMRTVPTHLVTSIKDILEFESIFLSANAEGLIFRARHSGYRDARSTTTGCELIRLKRWVDTEGEVVGYTQMMRNDNPQTENEVGRMKRSSDQSGKVPEEKLGAVIVKLPSGDTFNLGGGFKESERIELWKHRDKLIGKFVKYKHFDHGGYDKPRMASFLGFREKWDMGK